MQRTRMFGFGMLVAGLGLVMAPARATAQQGAPTAEQDSVAKDSVKKARAAECQKANDALMALAMKKMQEQQKPSDSVQKDSTQKDSTRKSAPRPFTVQVGPTDLPKGVTMQTLMRCNNQSMRAPKPSPARADSGASAAPSDSGKKP